MHNSVEKIPSGKINLVDVLVDIQLTNVTEIKIIQEVVSFIDVHYANDKANIRSEKVAALILNRDDLPALYATSSRGYNNQVLKFQNQYGIKVREELIPWAMGQVFQQNLPPNHQPTVETPSTDIFEVLGNINLANVTEFQVIEETFNYIHSQYAEAAGRINLSDVCALILNHNDVSSLYATSAEEYQQVKQIYFSGHQPRISKIIQITVAKVSAEGSENSISQDSLISVNYQRRKKLTKAWNT